MFLRVGRKLVLITWLSFSWDHYHYTCPVPHLWLAPVFFGVLWYSFAVAWTTVVSRPANGSEVQRLAVTLHTCPWSALPCLNVDIPLWVSWETKGPNTSDTTLLKSTSSLQMRKQCPISARKEEKQKHQGIGWVSEHFGLGFPWCVEEWHRKKNYSLWWLPEHYQLAREEHHKIVNGRSI